MIIYIHSMGRAGIVKTLKYLSDEQLERTIMVVADEEFTDYKRNYGKIVKIKKLPEKLSNVGVPGQKQFTYENTDENICYLDDDLHFSVRKGDGVKIRPCTKDDVDGMLDLLEGWIVEDDYAMVGVSTRNGNHLVGEDYAEVVRMYAAFAINTKTFKKEGAILNRVKLRYDFDVFLYMMEHGYPNRLTYKYAFGMTSGTKGGCALYRTPELMESQAYKLQKLHPPGVVKVVTVTSKSGWDDMASTGDGLTTRTDVNIQWKKAFKNKPPKRTEGILKWG